MIGNQGVGSGGTGGVYAPKGGIGGVSDQGSVGSGEGVDVMGDHGAGSGGAGGWKEGTGAGVGSKD